MKTKLPNKNERDKARVLAMKLTSFIATSCGIALTISQNETIADRLVEELISDAIQGTFVEDD